MTSSQYANHVCLHRNQSLRVKQKNKEESGIQIGVNAVNASLWLRIQKVCVVRTLTKFLKNYLKGKNALQNQAGSKWFVWKNQYYMLYYQPLITYLIILWKSWTIVHKWSVARFGIRHDLAFAWLFERMWMHANAFFYLHLVFIRLHKLAWHSNVSIKWQTFECHSNR